MSGNVFDHLKSTYFQECAELLDNVYTQLGALEEGQQDDETVHAIFRAIHSIKGGGGAFGFDRMVAFAHCLETLLDLLRDGKVDMVPDVVALLLRATDALSDLVAAERTGVAASPGFESALLGALEEAAGPAHAHASPSPQNATPIAAPAPDRPQTYRIGVQPHATLFKNASEPLLLIRELQRLGSLSVTADLSRLPGLDVLDPETAYVGWVFTLQTALPGRPHRGDIRIRQRPVRPFDCTTSCGDSCDHPDRRSCIACCGDCTRDRQPRGPGRHRRPDEA